MIITCKPDRDGNTLYDTESPRRPPPMEERISYLPPSPYLWVVGVDLGSQNDSTAITVLEVGRGYEVTNYYRWDNAFLGEKAKKPDLHFVVKHLHRPRLGTSYPKILDEVTSILEQLPWLGRKPVLVVDATGLGAPVVHQMRKQGLYPIALTITGGNHPEMNGSNWSVPKAFLVGELRLAMHRDRLKVAQGFQARERLETELGAFQAKLSDSGRATFAAAGSEHDDTVLSLAMAITVAKASLANTVRQIPLPY
jgi:hypothetical protein